MHNYLSQERIKAPGNIRKSHIPVQFPGLLFIPCVVVCLCICILGLGAECTNQLDEGWAHIYGIRGIGESEKRAIDAQIIALSIFGILALMYTIAAETSCRIIYNYWAVSVLCNILLFFSTATSTRIGVALVDLQGALSLRQGVQYRIKLWMAILSICIAQVVLLIGYIILHGLSIYEHRRKGLHSKHSETLPHQNRALLERDLSSSGGTTSQTPAQTNLISASTSYIPTNLYHPLRMNPPSSLNSNACPIVPQSQAKYGQSVPMESADEIESCV